MCLNDQFVIKYGVELPEIQPTHVVYYQIINDRFLRESFSILEIYFNSSLSFKPNNSRFVNLTEHEDQILAVNIFYKVEFLIKIL